MSSNKRKSFRPTKNLSRKRPRTSTMSMSVPRGVTSSPFRGRTTARLTYCDSLSLTPGGGLDTSNYLLRCNSIFSPDANGGAGAHQPYGHDTFATLFTHYSVKKATLEMACGEQNSVGSNWFPMMVGAYINDDTTVITVNPSLQREQPGSISKILTNDEHQTFSIVYDRDKRFPGFDQNRASSNFGANPAEQAYFNLFTVGNPSVNNDSNTVVFFIKITYEVEMWEPKKLAQS